MLFSETKMVTKINAGAKKYEEKRTCRTRCHKMSLGLESQPDSILSDLRVGVLMSCISLKCTHTKIKPDKKKNPTILTLILQISQTPHHRLKRFPLKPHSWCETHSVCCYVKLFLKALQAADGYPQLGASLHVAEDPSAHQLCTLVSCLEFSSSIVDFQLLKRNFNLNHLTELYFSWVPKNLSSSRLINHSYCYSTSFYLPEKQYGNISSVENSGYGRKNNLNYGLQSKEEVLSFLWRFTLRDSLTISKRFLNNVSTLNSVASTIRMLISCQSLGVFKLLLS